MEVPHPFYITTLFGIEYENYFIREISRTLDYADYVPMMTGITFLTEILYLKH